MFKIKLSPNMASQVEGADEEFPTYEKAWIHAIGKYGSGSYDSKFGWYIEEVKT